MKIVIVGAGKVGEYLSGDLSHDDNDIILIEQDPDILNHVLSNYDIMGVCGNGASYPILVEAGVGDCDVFVAVTPKDELNILSSVLAKKLGAKYTIARVRNPEYSDHIEFVRESLGIDLMLNPEFEAAVSVTRNLKYPSAIHVESFANNRVSMVEISIKPGSYLDGITLRDFPRKCPKKVLICIVERGDEVYIPDGNFLLCAGDKIHVTGTTEDLVEFYRSVGEPNKAVRSVIIIGGGRLTYYVLKILHKQHIETKVIEIDREKARVLAEDFPEVTFIHGDGTSRQVLDEEHFEDFDACVSLTGIDEENIIISMYAKKLGLKKTIAKVNRLELLDIVDPEKNETTVTPKKVVADLITAVVRSRMNSEGSNVITLYRLADNRVEASEFLVKSDSKIVGVPLRVLRTKPGILIGYIIRNNRTIFPGGEDYIKDGDRVIVVSREAGLEDIDEILE